jgi:hypothetical protein
VDSASLAAEVYDQDDDLDFFFYDPDGTLARNDLENEFLETFLLVAHPYQCVQYIGHTILTTINIGLSSLPTTGRARLLDTAKHIYSTLFHFQAMAFGPQPPPLRPWSHYVHEFRHGTTL